MGQFLLGSISPDSSTEPLDTRHEVGVHVDAGARQIDADKVRTAHALGPPHGAGDLWIDISLIVIFEA